MNTFLCENYFSPIHIFHFLRLKILNLRLEYLAKYGSLCRYRHCYECWYWVRSKPGGLDCWDQSRSRFLDLSRLTFEKCRDFLDCRQTFFCLGHWDFSVGTLSCQDFCWDCWDLSRNLDINETVWVLKWLKVSTNVEILTRNMLNSLNC
jgi:hypothetical protein